MAKQDFIKFYSEYLPKNPALKTKIDSLINEQEFAKAVLDAGPAAGFNFTQQEVEEVMRASEKLVKKSELSDDMLEAVAGGASSLNTSLQTVQISSIGSIQNVQNRAIDGMDPGKFASTVMCCW